MPLGRQLQTQPATPQVFYLEAALYRPFEVDVQNYPDVLRIEYFGGPLDAYCLGCQKESVFQRGVSMPSLTMPHMAVTPTDVEDLIANYREFMLLEEDLRWTTLAEYAARDREFAAHFHCVRDDSHQPLSFFLSVQGGKLMKVGQYPSIADLQQATLRRYRKALGEEKYRELNRAVGLSAHGVGIGSIVYLRRIFEHLIELAHVEARQGEGWDEEQYESSRMDEKVKMLRSVLPASLIELSSVYSILSKGIHELTEEVCLQYFQPLEVAIELILDEKMEQQARRKKLTAAKAALDAIKRQAR